MSNKTYNQHVVKCLKCEYSNDVTLINIGSQQMASRNIEATKVSIELFNITYKENEKLKSQLKQANSKLENCETIIRTQKAELKFANEKLDKADLLIGDIYYNKFGIRDGFTPLALFLERHKDFIHDFLKRNNKTKEGKW